jgi:hypothetical protein
VLSIGGQLFATKTRPWLASAASVGRNHKATTRRFRRPPVDLTHCDRRGICGRLGPGRFDSVRYPRSRSVVPDKTLGMLAGAPPRTVLASPRSSIATERAVGPMRDCRGTQVPGSVTAAFIPGAAVPFLGDSSLDLPPASIGMPADHLSGGRCILPARIPVRLQFDQARPPALGVFKSSRIQRKNRVFHSISREFVFRFVSEFCWLQQSFI